MTHPCSVHCVLNKALHDTFTPLDNTKSDFKRERTAFPESPPHLLRNGQRTHTSSALVKGAGIELEPSINCSSVSMVPQAQGDFWEDDSHHAVHLSGMLPTALQ